jgi:hypothetical protein
VLNIYIQTVIYSQANADRLSKLLELQDRSQGLRHGLARAKRVRIIKTEITKLRRKMALGGNGPQLHRSQSGLLMKIQWNSLKMSPVKKISRLRSQDKKAPKFSHLIHIMVTLLMHPCIRKFPASEVTNLTTKQFFFTRLIHFLFQNLKEFPRVSIHSVCKMQHSNGAWSRSLPPHFTQQSYATSRPSWRCHVSSTVQRL